jgi:hypothetical protein
MTYISRAREQEGENARIDAFRGHTALLRPDYLATLKARVYAPSMGFLEAGAIVEIVGDCVRVGGYSTPVLVLDGVNVAALALCKPYYPLLGELVVSPATGNLVPANCGTARRVK